MANIADLKNNLSALLRLVESGEEIVICRYNQPIARIAPVERPKRNRTVLGWAVGEGAVHDDLQGPFIPPSDWSMHGDGDP